MKLTRRNILKTSVLSGAAILAGTSQATPVNAPAKWDATYDVVIIGAGGGGMMAAHYAAEKGLKPVVLKKNWLSREGPAQFAAASSLSLTAQSKEKKELRTAKNYLKKKC